MLLATIGVMNAQQNKNQELKNDFIMFDKNSDGFIDAGEMRSITKLSAPDMTAFFIAADYNEDGLISFNEYLKHNREQEENDFDTSNIQKNW